MVYDGLFRITAGVSKYGGPLCVDQSTSFEGDTQDDSSVFVYPNPISNTGTIEFVAGSDGLATVEMFNITGNKTSILFSDNVEKNMRYKVKVNTGSLDKGIYIIIFRNGNEVYRKKVSVFK